jgi:hypothetical protein
MRRVCLFVFLIFSGRCFCQYYSYNPADSLIKYSYFLQCYIDSTMSVTQGTGFFINNNGENLLVTAKHVLSGCRFNGSKDRNLPDEMVLYYNEDDHLKFRSFPLNIREIKDTAACLEYYLSPDVIAYPINDTSEKEVNSINSFLYTRLPSHRGKIVIFGYPSFNNMDSGQYFVRSAMKLEIHSYRLYEKYTYRDPDGSFVTDTINYTLKTTDTLASSHLRGYSGSPVFIWDYVQEKWVFCGVIIAIDDKNNLLTIVKPKNLFEHISYRSN